MKSFIRFFYLLVLLNIAAGLAFAGNTGKISGIVKDEKGELLVGANVLVVGTTRGASSDPDGRYSIIGVPLGSYTVRASYLGQTVEISNVKVNADETTQLNFTVNSTLEMKTVEITADQVLVNTQITGSGVTVNEKKIEQIPNVQTVQDVIQLGTGVVKQGNNLFLRGGRANEVQYVVDGIPVNNPLSNAGDVAASTAGLNSDIAKLQAGQSTSAGLGNGGLSVSASAIQSVSVQTSGFDADQGNAQSGVVNIVTKSGGDHYSGSLQLRTDRFASSNQNEQYQSYSLGGPEPISKYLLPSLGLNVPGTVSFFFNTDISRSDGINQYEHNEFYHPIERGVQLNGFLGGLLNGLGFHYDDNQRNSFSFNSKIKYEMKGGDQIMYGYRASLNSNHGYQHAWKFRADSSSLGATLSSQHVFLFQHFFTGGKSVIKFNLGKLENHDGNDVAGLKPWDYSRVTSKNDPTNDGFYDLGSSQRWYRGLSTIWTARLDYNGQIHPLHFLKTGFEFHYEEIISTEILYPNAALTDADGNTVYPPYPPSVRANDRGEYPGYGVYRWALDNFPSNGAFYVQDNIEFSGLNLHIGLRYDYFDLGRQVYYDDFFEAWNSHVNPAGIPEERILKPGWIEAQGREDQVLSDGTVQTNSVRKGYFLNDARRFLYFLTHGYVSPRLAIGYPITDRIVFFFNYGHFLQFPDRDQYFRDPFTFQSGTWVGNPDLKPQRTVSYEAGFDDQFTDDMMFSLHAFYKDIFDYPSLVTRGDIKVFQNLDYASARGFEASMNQAFTGNFTTSISYSYQIAKGRSSSPIASVLQPTFQLPRETRLDWDQQHTVNLFFTYRVGPKEEGQFLGLPFINNYSVSLTWSYGSGFPYTPYYGGRYTARNVYLVNNETLPYTSVWNLSFTKGFYFFDKINMNVSLDITNLFNRRNVGSGSADAGFNIAEGRPYEYGDYDPNSNIIYDWNQFDSRVPPYIFNAPRQILLGIKLNWD